MADEKNTADRKESGAADRLAAQHGGTQAPQTGGAGGIASTHNPGGMKPGGGPGAGFGSLGTGGASTGGSDTGAVKKDGH